MSELAAAFEDYCQAVEALGVRAHHRLAGPASPAEIDRLAERLNTELPPRLREWFEIANGMDWSTPHEWGRELIPFHVIRSIQETIDAIDEWEQGVLSVWVKSLKSGGRGSWLPSTFAPILADHERGWESGLFVDCADQPGRVVTFALESFSTDTGYWHDSLLSMVTGALRNVNAGYYSSLGRSVCVNDDFFEPPTLENSRMRILAWYGFDANGPTPPRMGDGPPDGWDYR